MKKLYQALGIAVLLSFVACSSRSDEPIEAFTATPTQAVATVTPTPEPTATPTPEPTATPTPEPTATPTPEPTATPTPEPTVTPTPEPTATPTPEPTATPTSEPTATPTPKPTATPTPKPTATPTQIPVQTMSPGVQELLNGAEHKNTTVNVVIAESAEQTRKTVWERAQRYSSFFVYVKDASCMNTAEEYMRLYPEIESLNIDEVEIHDNAICVTFSGCQTVQDPKLSYALRTGDKSDLSETEKQVYEFLKGIVAETGAAGMSRVEAVKALHDYLVLNLQYDVYFQSISYTPEGAMKNKAVVCDGYTKTMNLLLWLVGIECRYISGTANGGDHAWSLVKMEDGWYHLDVTWDDPLPDVPGRVNYHYFLKNDATMAKDHQWQSDIICNGNAYDTYAYREVMCSSMDEVQQIYDKQIGEEKSLTFCYPKDGILSEKVIKDYVMERANRGITYWPVKETGDYYVLEILNPFMK